MPSIETEYPRYYCVFCNALGLERRSIVVSAVVVMELICFINTSLYEALSRSCGHIVAGYAHLFP